MAGAGPVRLLATGARRRRTAERAGRGKGFMDLPTDVLRRTTGYLGHISIAHREPSGSSGELAPGALTL
jgi:hypothetical protein